MQVTATPIGYQGPAQHTYTVNCDGFHPPGQCNAAAVELGAPPVETGWDSGRTVSPDPSWPVERQLKWYKVASHVLLLNCSELVRRRAAAAADREA
jgi:hypothetical protein